MATGARFLWAPRRAPKLGPMLVLSIVLSIVAYQCQVVAGSTATTPTTPKTKTTRHQQQATSYLPSNQQPPHPTAAASQFQSQQTTRTTTSGGLDSRRKPDSEKGGSQRAPKQRAADKMARRMEAANGMPELTIEDETAGDSFLTTEETYEGGTSPVTAAEDSASSFAPDYEPDGDTVLEMTTTSVSASPHNHQPPPRQQVHQQHQHQVSRPLRQSGVQQRPPMATAPPMMQQPTPAPGNHRLATASYQPTLRSAAIAAAAAAAMPMPIAAGAQFNVNMGADRMMIKPHQGRHPEAHQELATESIHHEMRAHHQLLAPDERRQELLYPTPVDFRHQLAGAGHHLVDGLQLASASPPANTICYTPFGLLLVIMLTMLVTVVVCFATHYLLRRLGRRQFDLLANSKHFETKHRCGYLDALGNDRRRFMSAAARCGAMQQPQEAGDRRDMLFQQHLEQSADGKSLQRLRDEHGCAFDNPYFRDDQQQQPPAPAGQLRQSAKSLARYQPPDISDDQQQHQHQQQEANGSHRNEQLNFIEHHISNLHNRQVTSSVKELSVLGSPSPHHVVDLTNEEQRAKVIADPKEGDLIAVDITGHDFIGLGFDLCGGHNEGIFVRSVLSRGPARESGCIQPGDRIKCLNISFDQMTLQDATDILNSGSPYKLRLLLEKRASTKATDHKLRQPPAPILMRRNHRYYNQPATNSNYLSQNYLMAAEPHHYQHQLMQQQQHHHHQHNSGGIFKSYLRRLAQFVAPASGGSLDFGRRPVCDLNMGAPDGATPYYLGSAQARRHLLQGRGSGGTLPTGGPQALHLAGHLNSGYGSDGDEGQFVQAARRRSVGSLGAHRRSAQFNAAAASRQSFDSHHMFGDDSQTELNDMSLDNYQHRNAHHKLHGPPGAIGGQLFESPSRYPSQEPLRSAAARDNLEQTRSQPEIARNLGQENQPMDQLHSAKHQMRTEMKQHHSTPAMNLFNERQQEQWHQNKNESRPKEESAGSESSFADSTSKLVQHQRRASSSSAASSSAPDNSTPATATPTGSIDGAATTTTTATTDRDAGKVPQGKLKENNRGREDGSNKANNSRA